MDIHETIKELGAEFAALRPHPRKAAEYAFAIAELYARLGQPAKFKEWAEGCLLYLCDSHLNTLGQVACRHTELGGVLIPELFHEGTARQRFDTLAAQLGVQRFGLRPPAPIAEQLAAA